MPKKKTNNKQKPGKQTIKRLLLTKEKQTSQVNEFSAGFIEVIPLISTLTQITPPLWQKAKRNYSLLMKVKEESEKAGLKLNIQKRIMASGPITSWEIDGETMETVADFIFLGSKITADGDCSHEIKRHLLLGRTT